jgi:outer membrane protein
VKRKKTDMFKTLNLIVLIVLIAISGYCIVKVADIPKIGVVDNTQLISNFSEAISARKKYETEKATWDNNIKSLQDSIKSAIDIMAKGYDNAPKNQKEIMQKNLNHWNEEYARYVKAVQELSRKRESEALKPVLDKINSFVKNWGTEHGYDIIYGTAGGGVILTVNDKLNVTSKILSDLNELYGSQKTLNTDPVPNSGKTDSVRIPGAADSGK